MAFRNIVISNPSRLSVKHNSLIVKQEDNEVEIPIEDISTLMFENSMSSLSSAVLSVCAENNILIFSCDDKHMPNGIFTSYNQHSRITSVLESQLKMPKPFQKRCWQQIVIQKCTNQAQCLKLLNIDGYKKIESIVETIKSGDTDNREAYAAREYFKLLFGKDFNRGIDNAVNSSLNYGYAIFRGAVARSLVAYGYNTVIGLKHSNDFNSFNLVDDFMEPFRPIVDLFIKENVTKDSIFDAGLKMKIYNLVNANVMIADKKCSVLNAIDIMVQSFTTAIRIKNSESLKLPNIIKLDYHLYE